MKPGDRIEHQLFEYEERDQTDDATFEFERVTLSVPIGPYPAGETFAHVVMDFELCLLSLYKFEGDEEPCCTMSLQLTAVEYVKPNRT